jgi:hypothetical protein
MLHLLIKEGADNGVPEKYTKCEVQSFSINEIVGSSNL